ncbi:MAG: hypothetical protein M3R24_04770 [Chloroflexota bacterium]|nr:hypothetical protein [Chloroflexota bacterium]
MNNARDDTSGRPAEERAEEFVDHMSQRLGQIASLVALRLLKAAALVREEAEDVWAEAQSIRRGERG